MHRPAAPPLFFLQVRPSGSVRWTTQAVAEAPEVVAREAAKDWELPLRLIGGDHRVVSDAELEHEGGLVAIAEAIASFHAQALVACRWLPLADEIVGAPSGAPWDTV
ncbi:MAG TPA: hypothetical protein VGC71_15475 [Gaiellales bacterium]|jgi:hypothetical protein